MDKIYYVVLMRYFDEFLCEPVEEVVGCYHTRKIAEAVKRTCELDADEGVQFLIQEE